MRILGHEAVREFIHVERTQQHGTGIHESREGRCICLRRRRIAENLRPCPRCEAAYVVQVLHRDRNTGERARVAVGGDVVIDIGGLPACPLQREIGEAIQQRIEALDPRDVGIEYLDSRHLTPSHLAGKLHGAEVA